MIRPTPRLLAVAAALPVLAIGVILFDARLWPVGLALIAAMAALALMDAGAGLAPRRLEVLYEPPKLLYMGESEPFRVRLDGGRRGRGALIEATLDLGDKLEPAESAFARLNNLGRGECAFALTPLRRGEGRMERLWLRWRGPLGLVWRRRIVDVEHTASIIPNLRAVRRAAIELNRRAAHYGQKPQLSQGEGSEFDALREHAPGHDRRAIDWKRSARHRRLLSKEFQAERNHNVILAVDAGHLMREPLLGAPKLDHAINAALILAYQALREGDRVGAFGFDSHVRLYRPPQAGVRAFPSIQHGFASLDYSLEETNFTLGISRLIAELDRRSIIIVITDFLDTITAELTIETLQRAAKRHAVVFAALSDPALAERVFAAPESAEALARSVVAGDMLRERRAVIERLRRRGVDALDVAPADLDAALVNRYLRVKSRAMAAA